MEEWTNGWRRVHLRAYGRDIEQDSWDSWAVMYRGIEATIHRLRMESMIAMVQGDSLYRWR